MNLWRYHHARTISLYPKAKGSFHDFAYQYEANVRSASCRGDRTPQNRQKIFYHQNRTHPILLHHLTLYQTGRYNRSSLISARHERRVKMTGSLQKRNLPLAKNTIMSNSAISKNQLENEKAKH